MDEWGEQLLAKVSKTRMDLGATWLDDHTNDVEVQLKKRVRCRVRSTEGAVEQELSGGGISPVTPADRGLGLLSRSASRTLRNLGRTGGSGKS